VKFFGRKRPASALDRLCGAGWNCASCGITHQGMFHLSAFAPDFWEGPEVYEPNGAIRFDGDFLSEDFCVVGGEHFFVRCVFEIPVHGLAEKFGFGIWSTLSRAKFDIYIQAFDEGAYAGHGPWTGWFSNRLAPFEDTLNQPCWVHPQLGRQRPVITLADEDHELAQAQEKGIAPERVLELYAVYGHLVS
jgi:hypothetical protein